LKLKKRQLRQLIFEALKLDLEVGDVILTGKFKNKRSVVKELGVDEKGQPTVNGRPLLKFRIEKLMPQDLWSSKSKDLLKKGEIKENMKITKKQLRRIIKEEIHTVSLSKGRDLDHSKGEGKMTRSQLHHIAEYAVVLHDMIRDEDDLPEWVQSKIAVAASDMGKVKHYLEYKLLRMGEDVV
tara:strand:+ start:1085 stop:1630 length:546 start_codon:yes stop_codon:yes gene_type:complete